MKVGLYFGSFNPVHIGHCIIANHVLYNSSLEQVWFVVSPQNPFKASSTLLNEYHRLHLVRLAVEAETNLKASDIEFHLNKPSYTIDTLIYLQEKYPQNEFSIIMGSDSLQNLPKWKNAGIIMRDYEIFVFERPGFPITLREGMRISKLQAPLLEISATQIREQIKQKKSIRFLVPEKVKEEIEKNGYYR